MEIEVVVDMTAIVEDEGHEVAALNVGGMLLDLAIEAATVGGLLLCTT
jgi:hypothetical protein